MDPNAALEELRKLTRNLEKPATVIVLDNGAQYLSEIDHEAVANRIAELFDALDNWLVSGGFLPTAWVTFNRR